jgi:hypothetical protein
MNRLDVGDRGNFRALTPSQKFPDIAPIGAARMRVADSGREEFKEAFLRLLAGGGDQGGRLEVADGDKLVHATSPLMTSSKTLRDAKIPLANIRAVSKATIIVDAAALRQISSSICNLIFPEHLIRSLRKNFKTKVVSDVIDVEFVGIPLSIEVHAAKFVRVRFNDLPSCIKFTFPEEHRLVKEFSRLGVNGSGSRRG